MRGFISILLFVMHMATMHHYSCASFADRIYLKARNQYLRLYLLSKKDNIKRTVFSMRDAIKVKSNDIYQSLLSKYYDANMMYYSLPEDDRIVIEQIINLHF